LIGLKIKSKRNSQFSIFLLAELNTVMGQVNEKKTELQDVLASITAATLEQKTLGENIEAAQSRLTTLQAQLANYEEMKRQLELLLPSLGKCTVQLHLCIEVHETF
jgi:chromosome segregation ATPase